jgi:hypothetical protein
MHELALAEQWIIYTLPVHSLQSNLFHQRGRVRSDAIACNRHILCTRTSAFRAFDPAAVVRPVTRLRFYTDSEVEVAMIGRARRLFSTCVVASVGMLAVPAFAQKPANTPKGATCQCTDSTFSTAKTLQGACAGHGGVKLWWGAGSVVSPPPMMPKKTTASRKAATTASAKSVAPPPERPTAKCNDGTYTFEKDRDKACLRKGGIEEWYR